jgi:AcrR family transcriptional regulator
VSFEEYAMAKEPKKRTSRLTQADWVIAARATLVRAGVDRVRVQLLAQKLATTTGSFYWHFKNREELLEAVLDDWEERTTASFRRACENAQQTPQDQFEAVAKLWICEDTFDPACDAAMRDWARGSKAVEKRVRRVDEERIELLKGIFLNFGFEATEAFIRARITYFHQVGYYALRIAESKERRLELMPLYTHVLSSNAPRKN